MVYFGMKKYSEAKKACEKALEDEENFNGKTTMNYKLYMENFESIKHEEIYGFKEQVLDKNANRK